MKKLIALLFAGLLIFGFQTGFLERAFVMTQGYAQTGALGVSFGGPPGQSQTGSLFGFLKKADKKQDFLTTSYFTDSRHIVLETTVPFDALLAEGEEMPDPAFLKVYAQARAPAFMIEYCGEALVWLAVKCDLMKAEASHVKDGEVTLTGYLRFVPADDPGTPVETPGAELLNVSMVLSKELQDAEFSPETRLEVMGRAQDLCADLRSRFGSCAVRGLWFRPQPLRNGTVLTAAGVTLTTFATRSALEQSDFAAALNPKLSKVY